MRTVLLLLLLALSQTVHAQSTYRAPDGCELLATLRDANCVVRQVSACPAGNVVDHFQEGRFGGRAFYSHPALFLRFEGATGYVAGHEYGEDAPPLGQVLRQGDVFRYARNVYRNEGSPEPGDAGTEVMRVGAPLRASIGGRDYRVIDIQFEVTADGYRYRERALLLEDPQLTLGVTSTTYNTDGQIKESYSSIPESISLAGDPDFGGLAPAASCLPSS